MAKIIFPNITLFPTTGAVGVATTTKPRATVPHIVGNGSNGIAVGKTAKPVVLGSTGIAGATGSLTDQNGLNGKVYRIREALDNTGNVAPNSVPVACVVTDITVTSVYPPLTSTTIQFAPTSFNNSKNYKFELEDELEYVIYDTPTVGGDLG